MKLVAPSLALLALACAACAPSLAAPPCSPGLTPGREAAPRDAARPHGLEIALTSHVSSAGIAQATLTLGDGASAATRFAFAPRSARLGELRASDAAGPIDVTRSPRGAGESIVLARTPGVGGRLVYEVTVGDVAGEGPFRPVVEPTDLRVLGADVLVLPEGEGPLEVTLAIGVGAARADAATSFGVGARQSVTASAAELRDATLLAGPLGHADFRAADGDDFAVWAGYTAFDGRWVGAETASVRALVDEFVGLTPSDPRPATSLLLVPERRNEANASVRLAVRGLVVSVDPRAVWSQPLRLRTAQALFQRFIGGALWVGDRARPATGTFFSEGFSRGAAQLVLADAGIFEPADRAAEVNTLLAAIDLSTLGGASLEKLAAAPDAKEALRVATARGALAALALDATLKRAEKPASLKAVVRTALATGARARADAVTLEAFSKIVEDVAGADAARPILRAIVDGIELPLPNDLLGKCYRFARGPVAPFELGFDFVPRGEAMAVTRVVSGSAADKAGLAVGGVIEELRYEDGRSDVPVQLVLAAPDGKAPKKLSFVPAGKARPGRRYERVKGVPDSECR